MWFTSLHDSLCLLYIYPETYSRSKNVVMTRICCRSHNMLFTDIFHRPRLKMPSILILTVMSTKQDSLLKVIIAIMQNLCLLHYADTLHSLKQTNSPPNPNHSFLPTNGAPSNFATSCSWHWCISRMCRASWVNVCLWETLKRTRLMVGLSSWWLRFMLPNGLL